jgi:DNA polymerase
VIEPREGVREYLRGRKALGDPEIFVSSGERNRLLDLVRGVTTGAAVAAVPSSESDRLSRSATPEELLAIPDLASLRAIAESCVRCELHGTRTHVVFANGSENARVLCVGEAPGANEDATGQPFVGRAGQLLDRLLVSVGFPRADVFVCNVLKCRPPGNRNPLPEEIESCSPFMLRQVELVRPAVIVALGTFAAHTLLGTRESLRRLRGRTHLFQGYPLVVTYHPAALLRNPGWTLPTWEDLQLVRRIVDGEAQPEAPDSKPEGAAAPATPTGRSPDQLTLGGSGG